jgi:tRNA threonylcarbamoyladenosine biosynthesis protein TsaB
VLLLALDTATRFATVAVCDESDVRAEAEREVTTHSEGLLALVDRALAEAGVAEVRALDAIACGRGPGSFTGLRIGLATAKGLCLAARRPLVCLSSLLPLGAAVEERCPGRLAGAVLDARRGEVFFALHRGGVALEPESLLAPAALAARLRGLGEPVLLAGDGALAYRELLVDGELGIALAPEECHAPRARHLAPAARERVARGAFDDLAAAVPLYIRPSDARLPAGQG